jgi:hypothetical protein
MISRANPMKRKMKLLKGNEECVDKVREWVEYFPKESLDRLRNLL